MIHYILSTIALILLIIIAVLFFQVLNYLKNKPDDEVLGDEGALYIHKRLNCITVCIYTEAALLLAQILLHII